jgi:hypothetical protein
MLKVLDVSNATVRLVSVEVSLEFHLHLISCHIGAFDDVAMFLRKERRSEFYGDETRLPTLYES